MILSRVFCFRFAAKMWTSLFERGHHTIGSVSNVILPDMKTKTHFIAPTLLLFLLFHGSAARPGIETPRDVGKRIEAPAAPPQ